MKQESTKVLLTIQLEGGTLVRKGKSISNYEIHQKDLLGKDNKKTNPNKLIRKGTVIHTNLEAKPAIQHLNISETAYNFMVSGECPSFMRNSFLWGKLTVKQRLEKHLETIMHDLHGMSYSYEFVD